MAASGGSPINPAPAGGGGQSPSDQFLRAIALAISQLTTAVNNQTTAINNVFPNVTGTTSSASPGTASLPSNPAGFLSVSNNGATVNVPYYNV